VTSGDAARPDVERAASVVDAVRIQGHRVPDRPELESDRVGAIWVHELIGKMGFGSEFWTASRITMVFVEDNDASSIRRLC
jgi:hypothetical protein